MSKIVDSFPEHVATTLAWCIPRFDATDPANCFRSAELQPRSNIVFECQSDEDVDAIVAETIAKRASLIGCCALANQPTKPSNGDRLFAFRPQDSLFHGSSAPVSNGYIDENEIAPWDTWITSINGLVLTWVPNRFVSMVGDAIMLNPEECIRWAENWRFSAVDKLHQRFVAEIG